VNNNQSTFVKKLNARLKWFTFISIPVLTLGSVALILQLFFFRGSSSFFKFDFNSGILWKWQEDEPETTGEPQVVSQFFPQNLIPENFNSKPTSPEEMNVQPNLSSFVNAKTLEQLQEQENSNLKSIEAISTISIKPGELFNAVLPGEAIKRLESPTIFNPDAQCKSSKFSVGFSLVPSSSYRTLKYNSSLINGAYTSGQSENYRDKTDKMVVTFFGGIDAYYELTPRISLQTGLYYGSYGEQIQVSEIAPTDPNITMADSRKGEGFYSNPIYCASENIVSDNPTVPFFNQYRVIEVPFVVNYKLYQKKLIYEVQMGMAASFLDHADALVYDFGSDYYYWVPTSNFDLFNKFFATGIVGITASQMINRRAELFVNPQFKYLFTPTFNDKYPVTQHQMSTGLRMGIKFHL
jgi:hypothetical protein